MSFNASCRVLLAIATLSCAWQARAELVWDVVPGTTQTTHVQVQCVPLDADGPTGTGQAEPGVVVLHPRPSPNGVANAECDSFISLQYEHLPPEPEVQISHPVIHMQSGGTGSCQDMHLAFEMACTVEHVPLWATSVIDLDVKLGPWVRQLPEATWRVLDFTVESSDRYYQQAFHVMPQATLGLSYPAEIGIYADSDFPLSVTVYNNGPSGNDNVELAVTFPTMDFMPSIPQSLAGLCTVDITQGVTLQCGPFRIDPGQSKTIETQVHAASNTPLGLHDVHVTASAELGPAKQGDFPIHVHQPYGTAERR